jgi:hypothetical protein
MKDKFIIGLEIGLFLGIAIGLGIAVLMSGG